MATPQRAVARLSNPDRRETLAEIGVCLATRYYYPFYSGAALRFRKYAPGLGQRGIRMNVFTQRYSHELSSLRGMLPDGAEFGANADSTDGSQRELNDAIDGSQVHYAQLPKLWHRFPSYSSQLARYCEERRDEIDVVQFLTLGKWGVPWLQQLRRLGIGTVYTWTLVGELSSNPWKRALQRLDRRFPFNLVDRIVVSSGVMKRYVEGLGVTTPIHVIPNGVDLQRFRPLERDESKTCLRRNLRLDPDAEVILAIGGIQRRKGTDVLVDAFVRLSHEHPNAHLVLIGPYQSTAEGKAFCQRLSDIIASAEAHDRVSFIGLVNNVEEYLKVADLLVFPSRREGMGNAVLEAMACGVPVVLTPFVGLADELGFPGVHYELSSWDPNDLAASIRRLLKDRGYRRKLGLEGRRWVEQKLGINKSLDQYAALYRELTGQFREAKRRI